MKKILSIDGGGIRGIIPAQIIVALEEKLKEKTGKPNVRVADYFDFFAGTSTGGILTCLYLSPTQSGLPRSAQEAVNLYVKYGDKIFTSSTWHRIFSLGGRLNEKYSHFEFEKLLKQYFGNLKLSDLLKPCIIPSYDIDKRRAYFFTQQDAKKNVGNDFFIRDVCRATSAAPSYFEAANIKSVNGVTYPFIDGGIYANNPSLCAYSEVRSATGNPSAKDMMIVSLGTGSDNESYKFSEAKKWGSLGWIRPVIDIMMSGAAETTNYHLEKMYSVSGSQAYYKRIQPANLRNANTEMDDTSKKNINELIEVGKQTALECSPMLDDIAELLIKDIDSVKFPKKTI